MPADDSARRAEFARVYRLHSSAVWAVAYARRVDRHHAYDITQEAFLRLWRAWEAGTTIANERAWLLRVARNLAEDEAKSAFRRNGTTSPQAFALTPGAELEPPEQAERAELFACIRTQLQALAPADRDLLTLRYALDYSAEQIAELLDIGVPAVHMRLTRARQRLAERLTALGVQLPP
jgi:RNA polymerase sigma-70 factor (ECF subfamily)